MGYNDQRPQSKHSSSPVILKPPGGRSAGGIAAVPTSRMLVLGAPLSLAASKAVAPPSSLCVGGIGGNGGLPSPGSGRTAVAAAECSSRPKKKATAHHMKTRPKKTQPWDIRRKGPTAYPPLPPLPPDWTFAAAQKQGHEQEPEQGIAARPPAS